MYSKNKTLIQIVLTGMVIVNLLLAFFVLIPANPAQGAVENNPQTSSSGISTVQLSSMQRFQKVNQAARQFWMDLLPFWDE